MMHAEMECSTAEAAASTVKAIDLNISGKPLIQIYSQGCIITDWSIPLYACSSDCDFLSQLCTGRVSLGQASIPPWPMASEIMIGSCVDISKVVWNI